MAGQERESKHEVERRTMCCFAAWWGNGTTSDRKCRATEKASGARMVVTGNGRRMELAVDWWE